MRGPVAGRFTELEPAGRGGTGAVYRARDARTGDVVALKLLHGATPDDADRLAREAEVLAAIDHPGVVRYVDHGRTDDGELYLAMEWLDGETLGERLRGGPLAIDAAVALAARLAEALAAAHARGVVHRDVKPHNVLLVGGALDAPRVLDFGLARLAHARALTLPGTIVGTPSYMAPEQARGSGALDARADVFALGCLLYECVCGEPPFRADGPWAVLAKVLFEEPAPASERRADVPPALDALLAQALAKEPADRPDAATLAERLGALGGDAGPRPARAVDGLTRTEKRLIGLVVADIGQLPRPALAVAATMAATPTPVPAPGASVADTLTKMRAVARPFGAHVEQLAGGHLVAVLHGDGEAAADLAGRAARYALALRARLGSAPIVLATGAAMVSAQERGRGSAAGDLLGEVPTADVLDDGRGVCGRLRWCGQSWT